MEAVALAAIALAGTMVAGLFKLLNSLTKTMEKVASSSKDVAIATRKSASEAKARNGHLGDQNIKLAELLSSQNRDVVAIKDSTAKTAEILSKSALIAAEDREQLINPTQHIEKQVVNEQIIKGQ